MQKRWEKANRSDSEESDEESDEEEDEALEEFDEESDKEEATTKDEDITHIDAWMRHLRVPEGTVDDADVDKEPPQLVEELPRGALMRGDEIAHCLAIESATAVAPSTVTSTIPPEIIRERVQRQMK